MMDNSEETTPLNTDENNIQNENQVGISISWSNIIQGNNRLHSVGNQVLPVATFNRYNETIQLYLTDIAFQSFTHASHQLTPDGVSRLSEVNGLLVQNINLFHSQQEIPDNDDDYIEWSLVGENLIKKRREFLEQINIYKTYDNEHHSVTRLLIEIIDYYIKEYLTHEKDLPAHKIKKIEEDFQEAIREKNYLKYFIKAYTKSSDFYRTLNKHLALYILDYFDPYLYSLEKGYRLVNCLVYIVTLLINHPDIHDYQYTGTVYRGILMSQNASEHYTIGNYILNRAFVSTTEDRLVAQIFSGSVCENVPEQSSNDRGSKKVCVLLKYTIKQNKTAIDIAKLSTISDEREVLILPFSLFQVKNRTERCLNTNSPTLIEIDLEECEDDEQKNREEPKEREPSKFEDIDKIQTTYLEKPVTNPHHQTQKKQKIVKSKYFYGGLGLYIIVGLIVIGGVIAKVWKSWNDELGSTNQKNYNQTNERLLAAKYIQLGMDSFRKSNYTNALANYNIALEIQQKSLAPTDPDLAVTYNRIGEVHLERGDYSKGHENYKKALDIQLKSLPSTHPDLAITYNNIASVYSHQAEYSTALENYKKALNIQKQSLPSRHPDLAITYNKIGAVYLDMGEHSTALDSYKRALEIQQKLLSSTHPDLAFTYNNIAALYSHMGDHSRALENYHEALRIQSKSLPPTHIDLATTYNSIGFAYFKLGEYPHALENYNKSLEIRQKSLPKTHVDLAATYNNIGLVYSSMGQLSSALENYNKTLEILQKPARHTHTVLAATYNSIGSMYSNIGQHSEALENYDKALKIQQTFLNPTHIDWATTYNNIGSAYHQKGNYLRALENYDKALNIQKQTLHQNHPDLAGTYRNMGLAYSKIGQHSRGLEQCNIALKIQQKSLIETHPDLATTYINIGLVLSDMEEHLKALDNFNKALAIQQKSLSARHPGLVTTYKNIGSVYSTMGEYSIALENYNLALEIALESGLENHPNVASIQRNIESVYSKMAEQSTVESNFSKSWKVIQNSSESSDEG